VRAALPGTGTAADTALVAGATNSDFIIDQYLGQNLNAADIITAYNNGWVYGQEIRRNPVGNAREVSLDGGKEGGNTWVVFD